MASTAHKLGARIRLLRERSGITQEQLAEKAQTSNQYVSSLERGLQNITLDTLDRIAHALNVDLVSMFSFDSKDERVSRQSVKRIVDDADDDSVEKIGKIVGLLFK